MTTKTTRPGQVQGGAAERAARGRRGRPRRGDDGHVTSPIRIIWRT